MTKNSNSNTYASASKWTWVSSTREKKNFWNRGVIV